LHDYSIYLFEYPVLLEEKGSKVLGYVLNSKHFDEMIEICDHIEGYPEYYDRIVKEIELESGEKVEAYVYIMV